jgi:hypothetical protein
VRKQKLRRDSDAGSVTQLNHSAFEHRHWKGARESFDENWQHFRFILMTDGRLNPVALRGKGLLGRALERNVDEASRA